MIQNYRAIAELDSLHQEQHRTLFANSLGVVEKVATTTPTTDTLPVGYMQFANVGGVKSLYFNLNGTIVSADQAAKDYVDTQLPIPLTTAKGGTGSTANANAASGVVVLGADSKLPAVDGSQLTGINTGGSQEYTTSSGNWTCPAGVTKIYVTLVGGGGGGGSGHGDTRAGSGGGSGCVMSNKYFTVTPASTYAYSVGAGGAGGVGASVTGSDGGTTSFNSFSVAGGKGGLGGTAGTAHQVGGPGVSVDGFPSDGGSTPGNGGSNGFGAGGVGSADQGDANGGGGGAGGNIGTSGGAGGSGYVLIIW